MTDYSFIKVRNLAESRACISVPLYKWEKKVQQSCPDLTEHLTSIYALYEYRDVHCSIIIRRIVAPNYRFLFEDYFHRKWKKKLWSLRSVFFFKPSVWIILLQKDLCQQETEYTGSRFTNIDMLGLSIVMWQRVPDLSGLKRYFVIISHVSAVDWTQMSRSHLGSFRQLHSFRSWLGLLPSEGSTELDIPYGSLITACVGCGWAVDWSFYTRLFHVLGLPRIWKGLVEGASPVSIPRGPGRSWEVSYDLVLEGSEHHFCGFCCPENHQGRPTSQVREAASPSPYKEARSYKEGRNWWSSLEIISHIHQLP